MKGLTFELKLILIVRFRISTVGRNWPFPQLRNYLIQFWDHSKLYCYYLQRVCVEDFPFSEKSSTLKTASASDLNLTIELVIDKGGSVISETKLSFWDEERIVTGEALAEVIGVTAELPLMFALAIAFFVASFTSWNFSINFPSSASLAKPRPEDRND